MSTILLTSAGLKISATKKELLKLLHKKPSQLTLGHIMTASKVEGNTTYVKKDKQEMKKMGFNVKDIDIEGLTKKELEEQLNNIDIIYVQGGNGFYLLKHIRKSGFTPIVKKLIKKGVIYVGVSAGTYIACPTIEMHTWKDKQRDQYGLKDLTAMNLVPFLVTVHYNRDKYKVGVKEGIKKSKYPVKILTDDQSILIKNGKVKLVGKGKEIILS